MRRAGRLDGMFDEMVPFLPARAVPARARERLRTVVAWFPAALTNLLYFESRLGAPDAPVDMALCVAQRGHALLASGAWRGSAPPLGESKELWERIERWSARWHGAGSRPGDVGITPMTWMEFDVDEGTVRAAASQPPAPSVFLTFRSNTLARTTTCGAMRAALDACVPILAPAAHAQLLRALPVLLMALPAGAHVAYLGCLLSRPVSTTRVCFSGITWDQLWPFLKRAGWRDDAAIRAAATMIGGRAPAIVNLDVGDDVGPVLGLECTLERRSQVFGTLADRPMFDALSGAGLIPADAWNDLSRWPGCLRTLFAHQLHPSVLTRRVNHLKLVGRRGAPPEVKAYLCGQACVASTSSRRSSSSASSPSLSPRNPTQEEVLVPDVSP